MTELGSKKIILKSTLKSLPFYLNYKSRLYFTKRKALEIRVFFILTLLIKIAPKTINYKTIQIIYTTIKYLI